MEQAEKRKYLIKTLLAEQPRYKDMEIPEETGEQKRLLRSLFNVRMPGKIGGDFLQLQDEYLKEATKEKGITDLNDLQPIQDGIYKYIIIGELDVLGLDSDFAVEWVFSGKDAFSDYEICRDCIWLTDFENEKYRIDFNGKEI